VEQHFNCLEMLRIRTAGNPPQPCECGILLEIWPAGGVLQADNPMVKGEKFTIHLDGAEIDAEVQGYEEDIYGYYIRFAVSDPWFPKPYQPSYLKLEDAQVA
jgi:hypothetical protein